MELGLFLDDESLFEAPRIKQNNQACCQSYNVKLCNPLWFCDNTSPSDPANEHTTLKFQADHCYCTGQYENALHYNEQCQALLQNVGSVLWRDAVEGKARCFMRLGRFQEALDCAQQMAEMAQNADQVTASLYLLMDAFKEMGDECGERPIVQRLISLHPHCARLWIRLALLSTERSTGQDSDRSMPPDPVDDTQRTQVNGTCDVGANNSHDNVSLECASSCQSQDGVACCSEEDLWKLTCYTIARTLLKKTQNTVTSFAKEHNERLLNEVQNSLDRLALPENICAKCNQFVQKTLNVSDVEAENTAAELRTLHEISNTRLDITRAFNNKWMCWWKNSV